MSGNLIPEKNEVFTRRGPCLDADLLPGTSAKPEARKMVKDDMVSVKLKRGGNGRQLGGR